MDHLLHRKDKHKSSKAATHDKHHHHHHSLGKNPLAGLATQSSSTDPSSPASLDIVIESPPCVFYGTPINSTGALLSGRLRVSVTSQSLAPAPAGSGGAPTSSNVAPNAPPGTALTLNTLRLRLVYTATTKKPVSKDCPECTLRIEELGRWEFLTEPIHLKPGVHDFPFSYLLPGHLPATTLGSLGTVEYSLRAAAAAYSGEDLPPLVMPLRISRAVLPGNDKTSVRIFPPTNLAGKIILPSVVHPIGTFPVQMCLSGVVDTQEHTQTRWRLRKLIWRIEEHQKLVSTACPKHTHKLAGDAVATGGPAHHETRVVGHGEEKTGWKTDFDTAGGEINFEFIACLRPGCEPLCDIFPLMKPDGVTPINPGALEVRHNLVVELIVAEEFATLSSCGAVKSSTPTGAARVLRMLFHLNVTERSGLGISWDEEMPPVYADVPPSPPTYAIEPEDEEQIGLTGPGVYTNGGDASARLPKLPQYSRLEQMDSSLTPVQRPQDAHPAAHHRYPLALPLQDVASLSLDNPVRHSYPHAPPTLASSSSHQPSHQLAEPSRHHHHNSLSSASAAPSHSSSTVTTTSSASSSNVALPSTAETAHYQHASVPRPIHPAPPHPPVDLPSTASQSQSLAPAAIGAASTAASRRSSRSAHTHATHAPSSLRRSSTADGADESAVIDDDEDQRRISQSQDPRSTQGSLVPSSAVTSATSSSVSLARLSTASLQSASGSAGEPGHRDHNLNTNSSGSTAHAPLPSSVEPPSSSNADSLADGASSSSRHAKKTRRSRSFFSAAVSRESLHHPRSHSQSHQHINPFTPFLAPFVRARSSERDRRRHSRRSGESSPGVADVQGPSASSAATPAHSASSRSHSHSRPAPVPEDAATVSTGALASRRSQSRPADSNRSSRSRLSNGTGSASGSRPSFARRASAGVGTLRNNEELALEPDLVRVNRTGDERRDSGFLRSVAVISHLKSL